jgi:hypothetical protein
MMLRFEVVASTKAGVEARARQVVEKYLGAESRSTLPEMMFDVTPAVTRFGDDSPELWRAEVTVKL